MNVLLNILIAKTATSRSGNRRTVVMCALLAAVFVLQVQAQVISTSGTVVVNNTSGTVIVTNAVEANSGATVQNGGTLNLTDLTNAGTVEGNGSYSIAGAFTNSGTFTPGSSSVDFTGTGAQTIPGVNFNNLTISGIGTSTLAGTTSITGDLSLTGGTFDLTTFTANRFSLGGTFTIAAVCTLRIGGDGTTIPSNFATYDFDPASRVEYYGTNQVMPGGTFENLNVDGSGTTIALSANVDIVGDLIITDGILDLGIYTANRTTSGGTLSIGSGGTLMIGGTNAMPTNYTTYTFNAASTVEFSGTNQSIGAFNYGNLTVSASGTLTLANSGTIGIAGLFTPGAGTYVTTGSTIDFNHAGAQTVAAFSYNNLSLSTSGTKSFASGTTSIAGTLSIAGATADATTNSSNIEYSGTGAQTVVPMTYFDLMFSNGGTKTIAGAVIVDQNMVTNTGSIIVIDVPGTLTIHGDLDNSGSVTNNGSLSLIP